MENLWKKHKTEIKDHLSKIEGFLKLELNDTSRINEISQEKIMKNEIEQNQPNIFSDENLQISDEIQVKTKRGRPRSKRREIYGKLRDIVKNIMKKEGLSRAQAYRKAKKTHEKSHKK